MPVLLSLFLFLVLSSFLSVTLAPFLSFQLDHSSRSKDNSARPSPNPKLKQNHIQMEETGRARDEL